MKARTENGTIKTYKTLPSEFKKSDGSIILNFRKASKETIEAEGFYDLVKPSYDPQTQNRGGLQWDESKKIFTFPVTDIDFNQEVDVIGEDGKPTGEKEKTEERTTNKEDRRKKREGRRDEKEEKEKNRQKKKEDITKTTL